MTYQVKEIFYTLQGEGANAGRPAVFCRFAGCNLWSGREADRGAAQCRFCDTDFVGSNGTGGGRFGDAGDLAQAIASHWPRASGPRLVVLTGGEPLLQVDEELVQALHAHEFEIAIETNGTILPPEGIDWICVSPKANAELQLRRGRELKVVVPQEGLDLNRLIDLPFDFHFLQPMDGPQLQENTKWAIDYCMRNPRWSLSLQTHKLIGIR